MTGDCLPDFILDSANLVALTFPLLCLPNLVAVTFPLPQVVRRLNQVEQRPEPPRRNPLMLSPEA